MCFALSLHLLVVAPFQGWRESLLALLHLHLFPALDHRLGHPGQYLSSLSLSSSLFFMDVDLIHIITVIVTMFVSDRHHHYRCRPYCLLRPQTSPPSASWSLLRPRPFGYLHSQESNILTTELALILAIMGGVCVCVCVCACVRACARVLYVCLRACACVCMCIRVRARAQSLPMSPVLFLCLSLS